MPLMRALGMCSARARVRRAMSGPPSQSQALERRHVIDLPDGRVRLHRPAPALLAVPAAPARTVSWWTQSEVRDLEAVS